MIGLVRIAVAASATLLAASAALADADSYVPKLDTAEIPQDEAAARRLYETVYPKSWLEMLGPKTRILPQFEPPAEKGKRPAYLSMGDSISLCYLPYVRKALADRYAVHRIPHNGASTERGEASLDAYLEAGPFDLVTVNWGLHDLIHNKAKTPDGTIIRNRTPLPKYQKRLESLVGKLKASGATVVWVNTTPAHDAPRYAAADVPRYNAAAAEVMAKLGVPVVDLDTSKHRKQPINLEADGIHYDAASCRVLGETLVAELASLGVLKH